MSESAKLVTRLGFMLDITLQFDGCIFFTSLQMTGTCVSKMGYLLFPNGGGNGMFMYFPLGVSLKLAVNPHFFTIHWPFSPLSPILSMFDRPPSFLPPCYRASRPCRCPHHSPKPCPARADVGVGTGGPESASWAQPSNPWDCHGFFRGSLQQSASRYPKKTTLYTIAMENDHL